jgi:hypothetical protein
LKWGEKKGKGKKEKTLICSKCLKVFKTTSGRK